jgi:serine/threonine-protein kinase
VKPGNVLVADDGTVKITDFGIAWSASSVPLTRTGQVVGTAHYLSPEQAAGGKATPASDVYALGLIGYECLAGRRAFDGENSVQIALMQLRDAPAPLPDDVPENVRTLIARALVKDPADRFADGAAFRDAVDDVLAGRRLAPAPTRAFAVPGSRPPRPWRRLLVPLVALLAGAGIAGAAVRLTGETPPPATAAEEAGPTPLVIVAEEYLGRPVAEVEAALGARGLQVDRVPVETTAVAAGLVTAISPAGAVSPGERISVSFAVAPPPAPAAPAPTAEVPEQVVVQAPAQDGAAAGPAGGAAAGRAEKEKEKEEKEKEKDKKDRAGGNGRGAAG